MNPLVSKLLTGLLRQALTGVAGYLIAHNILTQGDISQLIAYLVMGAGSLAWALYTRYKDHLTLVTALASPMGSTIASVQQAVASGQTAPVLTPANVPPRVLALLLAVMVGGMFLSGCSSNPRVNLVNGSQAFTDSLKASQDAENLACGVDATTPTHCDLSVPGVASAAFDSAHQTIEGALDKILKDKKVFDVQAAAWQPGQGLPPALALLQADVNLALNTAKGLPSTAPAIAALITKIQAIGTLIVNLLAGFAS